jgi:hypothetical protein
MTGYGVRPEDDGGLRALFARSPDFGVHTSVAAETAFLLGLVAAASAPFSVMHTFAVCVGGVAVVLALVGVATTSRPYVAGGALVPVGLGLGLLALVLVALRYAGLDTAFGDELLPTIRGWLDDLNGRFPAP